MTIALVTLVERRSRLSLIALAPNKTAEAVKAAILKVLQPLSAQVHTLTYDNGKEFAYHMEIAKVLKADGYFAHPYHSWERGLNENTNGLIPMSLILLCHISDSRRRQAAKASCLRRCRS